MAGAGGPAGVCKPGVDTSCSVVALPRDGAGPATGPTPPGAVADDTPRWEEDSGRPGVKGAVSARGVLIRRRDAG